MSTSHGIPPSNTSPVQSPAGSTTNQTEVACNIRSPSTNSDACTDSKFILPDTCDHHFSDSIAAVELDITGEGALLQPQSVGDAGSGARGDSLVTIHNSITSCGEFKEEEEKPTVNDKKPTINTKVRFLNIKFKLELDQSNTVTHHAAFFMYKNVRYIYLFKISEQSLEILCKHMFFKLCSWLTQSLFSTLVKQRLK